MKRLNYHHLHYFWAVAKHGSVAAACKLLHLAQPTVSGQLRELERSMGTRLLERSGRGLVLTEMGRTVFRYADDIFALGSELESAVHGRVPEWRLALRVGVADVLPKEVVHRMLLPVLELPERVRLVCVEGKTGDLLARLTTHDLDVVLADSPVPAHAGIRAYSHRLGESSLALFGTAMLARRHARNFPRSLEGAPLLLPTASTALRRSLDHWLQARAIRPRVVAEFEDSALLRVFGEQGAGLFVAPVAIGAAGTGSRSVGASAARGMHQVGPLEGLTEQFYAISMERKIRHPAVVALTDQARHDLLATAPRARRARG